jgi:hypothetical protein
MFALKTRPDADDDGVAIFWRLAAYQSTGIDYLAFDDPKRNQGAVRVDLMRVCDQTPLTVIATHLSSGSKPADEAARMKEITEPSLGPLGQHDGSSLAEWFNRAAEDAPVVMCLDSNSNPVSAGSAVWKTLNSLRSDVHNVWEEFYNRDGWQLQQLAPMTTNKMRGPLSDQPKKVGEHAYGTVDSILFSGE